MSPKGHTPEATLGCLADPGPTPLPPLSSPGPLGSPRSTTFGGYTWVPTPRRSAKPAPGESCQPGPGASASLLGTRQPAICGVGAWGGPWLWPCVLPGLSRLGSGGIPSPPQYRQQSLVPQVWLCHHAEVTQQDNCCETVGTAVDQELPVWWAVAESASQLFLSHSPPVCVCTATL